MSQRGWFWSLGIARVWRHRTLAVYRVQWWPMTIGEASGEMMPPGTGLPTRSGAWTLTDEEMRTVNDDWIEV